ncbi:MAG: agglutinin biogenesis protein MshI [Burkholderiales bacterium]|nr:agglutinin biogenesis protein MshI [Burkholderiales bacterium]
MAIFSATRKKQGWVAISLHADRVDLAHVRRKAAGRPEIVALDSYRREGPLEEVLSRLRKAFKLNQYRCATSLALGEYQVLQMEAPSVPLTERREALRWQIKDLLDYPVQSATLDVLDIPTEGAGAGRPKSVFAIAAPNGVVGERMGVFDAAHIPLEVIDIPELAQRNVAALFEEANRGLALLSFDQYGGLLTITYRGELYASRRIEVTLEQLADADVERRTQYHERIGLELQRSLDNFDRQYGFISLTKLLLLPVSGISALIKYLGANLYVPVETLDLARVMDFPSVPELKSAGRQAQCLQTIGIALRTEGLAA